MTDERRKGEKSVPDDYKNYMNDAQMAQLHAIENFGWDLKYVRHPLFQECVIIVTNADGSSIGVLEDDGRLNLEPDIKIRD